MSQVISRPRISGHETFVCRYAWLPKVVREVRKDPTILKSEDEAMVALGVGKNMARSARFWAESAGVIMPEPTIGHRLTPFGELVLGEEGYDSYLEKAATLWLLHWHLATQHPQPLFVWHQMLNHWHRAEFSSLEAVPFLQKALPGEFPVKSKRTISDGFKVFVNSYVSSKSNPSGPAEDSLDCPFAELGLIRSVGQQIDKQGNKAEIFSYNQEEKRSISPALFQYCLIDFWRRRFPDEQSMPFKFVCSGIGSPGQIFKLPELAIRNRLEDLAESPDTVIEFSEGRAMQQLVLKQRLGEIDILDAIYSNNP